MTIHIGHINMSSRICIALFFVNKLITNGAQFFFRSY